MHPEIDKRPEGILMSLCMCELYTHVYLKEWTFNVFILLVVYAEDEVQTMPNTNWSPVK